MAELRAALAARVDESLPARALSGDRGDPRLRPRTRPADPLDGPDNRIILTVSNSYAGIEDMPNVVGDRYQITIDKRVREQLGIKPGDQAVEWVEDGKLVVGFLPRPHNESMLGILKKLTDQAIEPITDWEALKDRAWTARTAEIREALEADSRRYRTARAKEAKPR